MAATYSPAIRSTIGAVGLNFSVRNGKRWNTNAITTRMTDILNFSFAFAAPCLEPLTLHRFFWQYNFGQARHGGAAASFGQLVRLGFDVTVFTPASYLRHRL